MITGNTGRPCLLYPTVCKASRTFKQKPAKERLLDADQVADHRRFLSHCPYFIQCNLLTLSRITEVARLHSGSPLAVHFNSTSRSYFFNLSLVENHIELWIVRLSKCTIPKIKFVIHLHLHLHLHTNHSVLATFSSMYRAEHSMLRRNPWRELQPLVL